jgi:hypothetical protein
MKYKIYLKKHTAKDFQFSSLFPVPCSLFPVITTHDTGNSVMVVSPFPAANILPSGLKAME